MLMLLEILNNVLIFNVYVLRDSKCIDILPKKIVLFPIPILILFPVTSPAPFYRFPVSLQDLQKPHWKPITPCHIKGGQKTSVF